MKQWTPPPRDIQNRADQAIASGSLTNSKRPQCLVNGIYPTHIEKGSGCYVWDHRGTRYIDFICGLGTNLLGYANEEIGRAIEKQLSHGALFSMGTEIEVEAAEKVKELFPFIDRVRFLKTGSEACTAAVRIARAKTGRRAVLTAGYHGFHDQFVGLTPPAYGVDISRNMFAFNHVGSVTDEVAAVILEPVLTDFSEERIEYLRALRKKCDETGTMLIFDEIITGFRFQTLSVASRYGIIPDLICFGKAIANGMPLSVVGGKKAVMECEDYFVSSTYAGETLSLASALKVMQLIKTPKYDLDYLWNKGAEFMFRFNSIWPEGVFLEGYPTRGVLKGKPIIRALFMQEACKAGILFGPSFFFNFHHTSLIDSVINVCSDILMRVKTGAVQLHGEMPVTPIAQQLREAKSE